MVVDGCILWCGQNENQIKVSWIIFLRVPDWETQAETSNQDDILLTTLTQLRCTHQQNRLGPLVCCHDRGRSGHWPAWCSSWGVCPRWPRWCSSVPASASSLAAWRSCAASAIWVFVLSGDSGTLSKNHKSWHFLLTLISFMRNIRIYAPKRADRVDIHNVYHLVISPAQGTGYYTITVLYLSTEVFHLCTSP